MPLFMHLKSDSKIPMDASLLLPERLESLSLETIASLPLTQGNQTIACGELFELEGVTTDGELIFQGDCRQINGIGAGMTRGRIQVSGNAGRHVARRMSGGEVTVNGNVGDWGGAELSGGLLIVNGSAGNSLGGAYPGEKKGMRGGEISVSGGAGTLVGQRMRRGLIAVSQSVGEGAGAGMIAGTLVLAGGAEECPGIGMKRGTILMGTGEQPFRPWPTFAPVANPRPAFLQLLLNDLHRRGFPIPADWSDGRFRCYRGDLLEGGLGELFILQDVASHALKETQSRQRQSLQNQGTR